MWRDWSAAANSTGSQAGSTLAAAAHLALALWEGRAVVLTETSSKGCQGQVTGRWEGAMVMLGSHTAAAEH